MATNINGKKSVSGENVFVVNIIGDLKLGGLCDSDAFREQMERTVEIYSGDYEMQLNGSSDEYECMRLITGGCS